MQRALSSELLCDALSSGVGEVSGCRDTFLIPVRPKSAAGGVSRGGVVVMTPTFRSVAKVPPLENEARYLLPMY